MSFSYRAHPKQLNQFVFLGYCDLGRRTSVYSDKTMRFSGIDVVCQEKHLENVCSGAI